jgi:hypothetical protein
LAIDSANKRRNVLNIAVPFLYLGLLPTLGIDTNDRENLSEVYIGFTYEEVVAATGKVRFIHGFGVGMGF